MKIRPTNPKSPKTDQICHPIKGFSFRNLKVEVQPQGKILSFFLPKSLFIMINGSKMSLED